MVSPAVLAVTINLLKWKLYVGMSKKTRRSGTTVLPKVLLADGRGGEHTNGGGLKLELR